MSILRLFYRIVLFLYALLLKIAAIRSNKAKQWVDGRKNWAKNLSHYKLKNCVWIHCASLGEFEQGRPIIEQFKSKYPQQKILLTFFSPSGYEYQKNYAHADAVVYLPIDNPSNARKFIAIVQPSMAIFVKYEFWYYYLKTLNQQKIPTFLTSAVFTDEHIFFKKHGALHRKMLNFFNQIFVQDKASKQLLSTIGVNAIQTGDSRIDRVISISKEAWKDQAIERFLKKDRPTLIFGSSWEEDEMIYHNFINKNFKKYNFIIAPHEISSKNTTRLKQLFKTLNISTYSNKTAIKAEDNLLIIDTIGILSKLYRYGDIAYIGGAFKTGLHNTLEPAAYGLPILFGPKYDKFVEAVIMVKSGAAFTVDSEKDFEAITTSLLDDKAVYTKSAEQVSSFINTNTGATARTMKYLSDYLS